MVLWLRSYLLRNTRALKIGLWEERPPESDVSVSLRNINAHITCSQWPELQVASCCYLFFCLLSVLAGDAWPDAMESEQKSKRPGS